MVRLPSLATFVVSVLLASLVAFVDPAQAERRQALVIGNAAYAAAGRLTNPVNDAEDVARTLRELGFTVDLALDLDKARFEDAISAFSQRVAGADVALVYYAGHGMGLGRETHLLPVDADFANEFEARRRTIGLTELLGTLEGRARIVLAFVDACRDNPLAERLQANARSEGRSVQVSRGLARIDIGSTDTLVVYATTPGRTAADGAGRNSPFTAAFLAHVATEGTEVETMLKRVSARVLELTGNKQEPERLSRLKQEFYFKRGPAGAAPAAAAPFDPNAMAAADFDRATAIGTVEAWDWFLSRHPIGGYTALARQAREKLASAAAPSPSPSSPGAPTQMAGTFPMARPSGPVSCADRARLVSASARSARPLSAEEAGCLQPKDVFKECDGCPEMVVVPAGSFTMGSPGDEVDRDTDEGPQRTVTFSRPLAVAKYPVTVDQFRAFVTATAHAVGNKCWVVESGRSFERSGVSWSEPRFQQTGSHPVTCVDWNDAKTFAEWLSKVTGQPYRLLSEAEWEYSARGRTETGKYPMFFFGDDQLSMCRHGNGADLTAKRSIDGATNWQIFNCDDGYSYTSPVGSFRENAFGLSDVHGNVWQWVEDCYTPNYRGASTDGSAATSKKCSRRTARGGSWFNFPGYLRSANRQWFAPDNRTHVLGFRVARSL